MDFFFNRIFSLSSSFFQQNRRVPTVGLRVTNLASLSSTFQRWSGALPDEIARSWEETSLKSPRRPKISSSTILLASRQILQRGEHGWDFTVRQTRSFTGQTTPRWLAIPHGPQVNRTVHQVRSVATSLVRQITEGESGMTYHAAWASQV